MKPFAPLKAEECWNRLIQARRIAPEESFAQQLWPKEERQQDMMVIVQINGKMKKTLRARSFGGVAVGPIEHRSSSGEDGGGPQFVELPAARHQGDSEGKPYQC